MILKVTRILPYELKDNFKGGKDRLETAFTQILLKETGTVQKFESTKSAYFRLAPSIYLPDAF